MAAPRARACFCLSKARDGDGGRRVNAGGGLEQLRAELEALKLGALIRRAKAAGVAAEQIEEACDAEDSKGAIVELVLAREQPAGRPGGGGEAAALRASLADMKTSQLRKRCVAAGIPEAELEEADDADDSHSALVELLVAHEPADRTRELRAELEAMKKGALRRRAVAAGVNESALEAADDAED